MDLDPAGRWAAAGSVLIGSSLHADQTLANARRHNRPVIVPTADLPAMSRSGVAFASLEIAPWATVLPLFPGGDAEGVAILLSTRPDSAASATALTAPASRLASLLGRTYAVPDHPRPPADTAPRQVASAARTTPPTQPAEPRAPGPHPQGLQYEGMQLLLSVVRDGLIAADAGRRVLTANGLGRDLLQLLQPQETEVLVHDALVTVHALALAGREPEELELEVEDEPRRFIRVRTVVPPVPNTVLLMLHDVTDERLIHERLLQSEKMASIGQLVSGVAHELNNPLTGIMGFAQLLLMRDLPDQVRREVTTIHEEAERASRIVQNLLSFSRRRRPDKERVDVNALIERVIELRRYELRVHNIDARVRLQDDLRPVLADPHQIQQVLLNVIGNAEQAVADHGGGTISCTTTGEGDRVRIVIADDGTGIAPEHVRRVFDPFFTTKQMGEGTGLGLTISYGIIEEHGGQITLESQVGRGTTVTIDLPAMAEEQAPVARPDATIPVRPRRSLLVIDDEPSVRTLLASALTEAGHDVEAVADGASGLQRLAARDFDLIITDVKMPGVDGVEFYRRVHAWNPDVARRIVFTSGDLVSPYTRNFLDSVDNPYLAKPFRLADLKELVATMLPE